MATDSLESPEPVPYDTYDYAILRVMPRVERGEFVNVGVLVSCQRRRFLQAYVEPDEQRLKALDPSIDMEAVHAHLNSIVLICAGGEAAGPIGKMSQRERFHWLVAPKSALIQTSPAHTGRCQHPEALIERLMDLMVRTPQPARQTVPSE